MKLVFGSDHAGFAYRQQLAAHAALLGHTVTEVGAPGPDSYDYPRASDAACMLVLASEAEFGILICGSGIGVSIRANRYPGIRAALCMNAQMSALAREHNHANVLCLGARLVAIDQAKHILETFLTTEPDTADRHAQRVMMLDDETSVGPARV